jgi:hypothetical protein
MNTSLVTVVEQVDALLDQATNPSSDVDTGVEVDLTRALSDGQLREVLVKLEQTVNRAQAIQAQVMVQMGVRARAADQVDAAAQGGLFWSRECQEQYVPDEIGVLLGWTKTAASVRYGTACQAADLPAVGQAWRAGVVDARKVATICDQLSTLEPADAEPLAADAVGYVTEPGRSRTGPQLREWLRRRVIEADPEAAEVRRQQAMGDRRVVITAGEDGMSELWALLPSVQARQIQQALTATAQQCGADDARSMDQRRADTMVDLLLGRGEPSPVDVQVIVTADTLTGAGTEPGWVPGLGPVTADQVTELIGSGTGANSGTDAHANAGEDAGSEGSGQGVRVGSQVVFRRLVTDPATGTLTDLAEDRYRPSAALDRAVRARDVTCRFPGCRRSADSAGTDLDHTVPYPAGPTAATNLAVLCRRHHRLKHVAGWTVTLHPTGTMTWTTPTGRQFLTEPWHYTDPDPPPDG